MNRKCPVCFHKALRGPDFQVWCRDPSCGYRYFEGAVPWREGTTLTRTAVYYGSDNWKAKARTWRAVGGY